jgi:hypothetical protein
VSVPATNEGWFSSSKWRTPRGQNALPSVPGGIPRKRLGAGWASGKSPNQSGGAGSGESPVPVNTPSKRPTSLRERSAPEGGLSPVDDYPAAVLVAAVGSGEIFSVLRIWND